MMGCQGLSVHTDWEFGRSSKAKRVNKANSDDRADAENSFPRRDCDFHTRLSEPCCEALEPGDGIR